MYIYYTRKKLPDPLSLGPKEYSLHVVGLLLLQRSTNCTHSSCPPQWGPVSLKRTPPNNQGGVGRQQQQPSIFYCI